MYSGISKECEGKNNGQCYKIIFKKVIEANKERRQAYYERNSKIDSDKMDNYVSEQYLDIDSFQDLDTDSFYWNFDLSTDMFFVTQLLE